MWDLQSVSIQIRPGTEESRGVGGQRGPTHRGALSLGSHLYCQVWRRTTKLFRAPGTQLYSGSRGSVT